MKTEIIAWVLLSILGIATVWLGYRAVEYTADADTTRREQFQTF